MANEDDDATWVAVFLSEAVLQMAEGENRDLTVDIGATPSRESAGFTLRFGKPGGPEFRVTVERSN